MKLKGHLSVCLSARFGTLITQPCQHRLLLKMNAVCLRITKCIFTSLYLQYTHCSLTGVFRRKGCNQPLTRKATGWWFESHCSQTFFLFQLNVYSWYGGNIESLLDSLNRSKIGFSSSNKTIHMQCCLIILNPAQLDKASYVTVVVGYPRY